MKTIIFIKDMIVIVWFALVDLVRDIRDTWRLKLAGIVLLILGELVSNVFQMMGTGPVNPGLLLIGVSILLLWIRV